MLLKMVRVQFTAGVPAAYKNVVAKLSRIAFRWPPYNKEVDFLWVLSFDNVFVVNVI